MTHQSKLQDTICCTLAALIASCVIFRTSLKYVSGWLPFKVQLTIILLGVLAIVVYTIVQKRRADKAGTAENYFFAFWHGVLRYFLAFDMVHIGLQKVFHLQFVIPLAVLDTPFSEMTGDQLIWAFFGKFYSFTLIIASIQILGSILLLLGVRG